MTKEFEIFMNWVQRYANIPLDGYTWEYNGDYYTSKQLFDYWKVNIQDK